MVFGFSKGLDNSADYLINPIYLESTKWMGGPLQGRYGLVMKVMSSQLIFMLEENMYLHTCRYLQMYTHTEQPQSKVTAMLACRPYH